jgi:hypothetical protein
MSDFWEDQAQADVLEREPVTQDIPAKKWYVGKTAHGSGAAAKLRSFEGKNGENAGKTFWLFATGFVVHGAEQTVDPRNNGRYCFGEWFIHPHPKEREENTAGAAISNRFLGALNALFSSGVGEEHISALPDKPTKEQREAANQARSKARWANTLKVLRARAEIKGLTIDDYKGDGAMFIAQMAVEELQDEPQWVLFYTKENTRKMKDGETRKETIVTSLKDCNAVTLADIKRAFVQFNEDDYPVFSSETGTF